MPVISLFKCVTCYPSSVLLSVSGLGPGPSGGGPAGPGGADPSGGGGGPGGLNQEVTPFRSTAEFEALQPNLAENSRAERTYYHGDIQRFLGMAHEYAFDEARRDEIDANLAYSGYSDEVESARRADLRGGAQRLVRDLQAAEAAGRVRHDLIADAFGVAQYAVGIPAGEEVPLERLAMLSDPRLRFIIGAAAVATGPSVRV